MSPICPGAISLPIQSVGFYDTCGEEETKSALRIMMIRQSRHHSDGPSLQSQLQSHTLWEMILLCPDCNQHANEKKNLVVGVKTRVKSEGDKKKKKKKDHAYIA
jgi:5-methylcytosine-specific restriction endonuclease McrA